MADVTLTYKGSTIAEMNNTGTKTLKTSGKYCEGDIGVSYVKPSSGGSDDLAIKVIEGEGAITELPSGITKIRSYAFQGNTDLSLTSLPNTVISIGRNAFDHCTGLTTLTFKGTPRDISSSAFSGCDNLTTINVPWAEGAVANAPWGATNATIHYNTTT